MYVCLSVCLSHTGIVSERLVYRCNSHFRCYCGVIYSKCKVNNNRSSLARESELKAKLVQQVTVQHGQEAEVCVLLPVRVPSSFVVEFDVFVITSPQSN